MKVAAKTIAVPASGYWPFGLEIEPTRAGLLLRPARKPREGWSKAFKSAAGGDDGDLRMLRSSANDFDRTEWEW
jgi:hypothetical protein